MKKEKHWFKFYPDKWMGDIELRTCTPIARALLIDLMSISFPNGIFDLKQREEKKQFIRQIGYTPIKFERSLGELLNKSRIVFDKKLDKFYIPKMRKDHEEYEKAQQNGRLGGNPNVLGVNPPLNPPLNPEVEEEEEKKKKKINIDEVLKYLNTVTGKTLRIKTEAHRQYVSARFEEGYSVDDFKKVVDVKSSQWLGDKEMEKHLVPKTIFSPSKFDGYLNEAPKGSSIKTPYIPNGKW